MTTNSGALLLARSKSTTVRANDRPKPAAFRAAGAVLPALSSHAPRAAAALADWLFFRPWRSAPAVWPEGGEAFTLDVGGTAVRGRRWGSGPPVFLVHGWEGSGAQMGAFVLPLVSRGFTVLAWDAPGHGASGGWRSSMVDMARAMEAAAATFGTPHAIVGHSLGGSAAILAARRGLLVGRLVLVGSPAHPTRWAEFAVALGVKAVAFQHLKERVSRRLGWSWDELDVPQLAVGISQPMLLVHDSGDKEVDVSDSNEIAAAAAEARVVRTNGLGHRRILRDAQVVEDVVRFVERGRPAAWDSAALENWLYDRYNR